MAVEPIRPSAQRVAERIMSDICVLADTHITDYSNWHTELNFPNVPYHDPVERTRKILSEVAASGSPPKLVVHLGDIVHNRSHEHYSTFQTLFEESFPKTPLLAVAGNHDVTSAIKDSLNLVKPTAQTEERDLLNLRFDLDGWSLFSIDANCGYHSKSDDSEARRAKDSNQRLTLEWLAAELGGLSSDARAVIFTHFPIVALNRKISGYPPTQFAAQLAQLLRKYQSNVELVMHGHIHCGAEYSDVAASNKVGMPQRLKFISAQCGSYPLTQAKKSAASKPVFDTNNPYGYNRLQLPPLLQQPSNSSIPNTRVILG